MAPPRDRSDSSVSTGSTDSSSGFSVSSISSRQGTDGLDPRFLEYDDGGNRGLKIPEEYLSAAIDSTEKREDFLGLLENYQVADHFEHRTRPVVKPPFMAFDDAEITKLLDNIKAGHPDINIYALTGVKKPVVTAAEFAARLAIEQKKREDGLLPQQIIETLEQEKFYKALREKVYTKDEFSEIEGLITVPELNQKFQRTTEVSCLVDAFKNVSLADFQKIIQALQKNKKELEGISPHLFHYINTLDLQTSFSFSRRYPYLIREYEKAIFNPLEVQAMLKVLNNRQQTKALASKLNLKRRVTMTELLGGSGLKQFQDALKEELDSPEFMKALWQNSVKKYDFKKPENTFLYLILSGVSGAGKSTSGKQAVERELKKLGAKPTEKGKGEVYLAWVDGGVARELNHMQKLVKYLCIEHGLEVSDLYGKSKALDEGKRRVQRQVTENPEDIGLVIPETYATTLPGSKKDFNTIKSIKNKLGSEVKVHVAYDFVVGINIGRHPKIVELMGTRRAFDPAETQAKNFNIFNAAKSGGQFLSNIWNSFIQSIGLAEGKAYGPGGYGFGDSGSAEHFQAFGEHEGDVENIDINRNFNCNDVEAYTTEGELWDFNSKSKDEAVVASKRLRDDWKANDGKDAQGKSVTLAQYARDNWRNYPNIMIEYKPGKLKFSFAPELEKTIKNTMTKKESRIKTLRKYLASQAYETLQSLASKPLETLGSLASKALETLGSLASKAYKTFISPQEEEERAEEVGEDFTEKLDQEERENLEFQLKLLKVLNELQDKDGLNKPEEITKALKEVRTLEKEKFAQERLEILDNFRTHHTLNVLVEAREMLEKRLELLMQLEQLDRIDDSADRVELEDPRKRTGAQIIPSEKECLDEILAEVESIKNEEDYNSRKYPEHIFSRLKILIDKRLGNQFKKENLKYLLALDRIVCQIDASNQDSVKRGIGLIEELKKRKNQDDSELRTKNRTTEPLIEEILDYYELRLGTLEIKAGDNIKQKKNTIKQQLELQLSREDRTKVLANPKVAAILRHPALKDHQDIFKDWLAINLQPAFRNLVDIISDLAAKHERLEYKPYSGAQTGAGLLAHLNSQLATLKYVEDDDLNTRLSGLFSISIDVLKLKKSSDNIELRPQFEEIEERLKQAFDALNQEQHQLQESIKLKEETIRKHEGLRSYLDQRIREIYDRGNAITQQVIQEYFEEHIQNFKGDLALLKNKASPDSINEKCREIELKTNDFFGLYLIAQKSRMKELKKVIDYEDATALSYPVSNALLKKVISDLSTKTELKLQDVFNALTNLPNDVRLIDLVEQMMTLAEEKGLFEIRSVSRGAASSMTMFTPDSRVVNIDRLRAADEEKNLPGLSELVYPQERKRFSSAETDSEDEGDFNYSASGRHGFQSRPVTLPADLDIDGHSPLVRGESHRSAVEVKGGGRLSHQSLDPASALSSTYLQRETKSRIYPDRARSSSNASDHTSDEERSDRLEDNTPIPVLGSTTPPPSCAKLSDMLSNLAGKTQEMSVGEKPITLYSASGQAYQYQYVNEVASASLQKLPPNTVELDKQKLCLTIISMINNILLHHDIVEITAEDLEVQQYAKDYIKHYNSKSENSVQLVVNNSQIKDFGTQSKAFDAILEAVSAGKCLIPQCVLDARSAKEHKYTMALTR